MQYFLCAIADLLLECLCYHVHGVYVCVHGSACVCVCGCMCVCVNRLHVCVGEWVCVVVCEWVGMGVPLSIFLFCLVSKQLR